MVAQACMSIVVVELEELLLTMSKPKFETILPTMDEVWEKFERSVDWSTLHSEVASCKQEKSFKALQSQREVRREGSDRKSYRGEGSSRRDESSSRRDESSDNKRPKDLPYFTDSEIETWKHSAESKTATGADKCWHFHMKGYCRDGAKGAKCKNGVH